MINRPNEIAPENGATPEEFIEKIIIATSGGDIGNDELAIVDDVVEIDPKTGLPRPGSKKRKVAGSTNHRVSYEKVAIHVKSTNTSSQSGGGGGSGHSVDEHNNHHPIHEHHDHTYAQIDPLTVAAAQGLIGPQLNLSDEKNSVLSETLARINILSGQAQDAAKESNQTISLADTEQSAQITPNVDSRVTNEL